jgi:hypothetical protein
VGHSDWEDIRFSSLKLDGTKELLELCVELADAHTTTIVLDRMAAMLKTER